MFLDVLAGFYEQLATLLAFWQNTEAEGTFDCPVTGSRGVSWRAVKNP